MLLFIYIKMDFSFTIARSLLQMSQLFGFGLLEFRDLSARFVAHDTTAPVLSDLVESVVEVGSHRLDEASQSGLVLGVDARQSERSHRLESGDLAQTRSATTHDAVRDAHLSAQAGKMDHHFNWVAVGSNAHQLGLLLLHSGGHSVGTY